MFNLNCLYLKIQHISSVKKLAELRSIAQKNMSVYSYLKALLYLHDCNNQEDANPSKPNLYTLTYLLSKTKLKSYLHDWQHTRSVFVCSMLMQL